MSGESATTPGISTPADELRIADQVRFSSGVDFDVFFIEGTVLTVHAIHPGRIGGTLDVHFTDGTVLVVRPDVRFDVVRFAPATDAEFDGLR
jgi:hypothetical protein